MSEAAGLPDASDAFSALVRDLCRFWSSDPDLLRRLVSLGAVDPAARDLIRRREDWTYGQVAAAVGRLGAEGRVLEPFAAGPAAAVVSAVTGFDACDEMARRTGTPLGELAPLLLAALRGVVRLG